MIGKYNISYNKKNMKETTIISVRYCRESKLTQLPKRMSKEIHS